VVLEEMPDHEHTLPFESQSYELFAFLSVQHEGLFYVNVLVRQKGFTGEGIVSLRRRGNHHPVNVIQAHQDFQGTGIRHGAHIGSRIHRVPGLRGPEL
jgi:hypothetical protein